VRGYYVLVGHEAVPISKSFPGLSENTQLRRWAEWFDAADRQVAFTSVGSFDVSTVFLGEDVNVWSKFWGSEPVDRDRSPLLFETKVFVRPPLGTGPLVGSDPRIVGS
jgi:hypothetical protein